MNKNVNFRRFKELPEVKCREGVVDKSKEFEIAIIL